MRLSGKVALVLGGAKGLGREIVFFLARQGVTVATTYWDWPEESATLRSELAALSSDHLTVAADLRDPLAVATLFAKIQERYGRLDILINNIERGGMPVVHGEYTSDQWELELATTLKAKRWVFHHALPMLKGSGDGAVVNITSIAGLVGRSGPAGLIFNDGYSAANRAVGLLTESWARAGAPEVRVNELMLGFFATRHAQGTRGWGLLTEEQRLAITDHILLGRTGRSEEVLKAIHFLLGEADYLTGATLRLDGGYVLGGEKIPPMPPGVE